MNEATQWLAQWPIWALAALCWSAPCSTPAASRSE